MSEYIDAEFGPVDTKPVRATGLAGWVEEALALLRLAVPLIFTQLSQMAIMTTDIVMLGRLSSSALAAATLGNIVFFFAWLIGFGPASAVSPMIAQLIGARPGERAGVRHIARMGLWAVLLISLPLMSLLWFTHPLLLALDQRPDLAVQAGAFTAALCFGLPASLGYQVLRGFATALGKPIAPLIVMLAAIGFNALGDYTLIFGHFGFPRLGIVGSGTASALSFTFMFLCTLSVIHIMPSLRKYRILRRFWRPRWFELNEVFRLGMPLGLTTIFEAMMFNSATLMMGTFGSVTLAAHQIAINVPSITFMVPLGLGMAATVRVGMAAGRKDYHSVRRSGFSAMLLGGCFMASMALIIYAFAPQIAGLYLRPTAANAAVILRAALFLHIAALFQLADGQQVVMAMSLRGLKDARVPMWLAGGSYWLVGFPLCLGLGFGLGLNGIGIWYGLASGLATAAILMTVRFVILAWRH
ncbi:MAG: MATE family efflux transporter [Alphaproteobacteria bacterium]|nr:MATE family efflux transporter [Alphaproteobacteria bacterium]